ncbi:hypothetical protein [Bacillus phage BM-P1]|nr:hypothetical protein [Bacillus phage BM-P1]
MKQLDLDLVRSLTRLTQLRDAGWEFITKGTGVYLAIKENHTVMVNSLDDLHECMCIENDMVVRSVAQ